MAPETIVAAVAQNTVWKNKNASFGILSPKCFMLPLANHIGDPITPVISLPNIIPKPKIQ